MTIAYATWTTAILAALIFWAGPAHAYPEVFRWIDGNPLPSPITE